MTKRVFNLSVRDIATEPAAELRISGPIGESFWDESSTSGRQFSDALAAIPAGRKINLRINSEGGSVSDGLEIYNAIKARSKDITAHITGYAVSIASVFPLAASKVVSPKSALWMIHKPWTYQDGNADEMRKAAEMLDKHEDVLVSIYAEATGQDPKKLKKDLEEETWMTGEQAVAYGLADESNDEPVELDGVENRFGYRRAPAAMGAIPPPQRTNNNKGSNMEPKTETTPSAGTTTPDVQAELTKARAALDEANKALAEAKRERITNKIDAMVADGRLTLDARTETIEAAVRDEKIISILDKLPKPTAPRNTGPQITVGASCGFDHVMALDTPEKRIQHMKANWNEYRLQGRRFAPQNANTGTDSATLLGTFLDQRVITVLQTRLGMLRAFNNLTDGDPMVPLKPIILEVVTAGGTAQTNATNFEDATNFVGTTTAVTATPAQHTAGGHITNAELNSGHMMDKWAKKKAQELAEKMITVFNALIVTGTFGTEVQTIAESAFGRSDMNSIWGLLAKADEKYAVLASPYIAKLLPATRDDFNVLSEGAIGWNGIIPNDLWTDATANTKGFFCHPQAISLKTGVPLTPPSAAGAGLSQSSITLPNGISVQRSGWFNTATRSDWFTLDVVMAAAVTDASAGRILKSS